MTDVSTEHPDRLPAVELLEQGRSISFNKDCLGDVKVRRSVKWPMGHPDGASKVAVRRPG